MEVLSHPDAEPDNDATRTTPTIHDGYVHVQPAMKIIQSPY
jgi:hypothetical protein